MAYTIPSDTHGVSDGGHTTDHNNVVDVLSGMGAVFNVLNTTYSGGADKTGTADSTAAIQAAFNAANSAGGGVVRIPAGTYKLTSALTIYSGITLIGDGAAGCAQGPVSTFAGVTVLNQTGTSANGISSVDLQDVTVQGLTLKGPGSGSGVGFYSVLSGNGSQEHLAFQDVTIENFGGNGLELQNPIVSRFDRVTVTGCTGKGFYIRGTSAGAAGTSCNFNACYAVSCGTAGWHIYNMTYCALNACASDTNGNGYLIDTCDGGITLNGCGSEATLAKNGFDGTSFKITGSNGVSLLGCFTYAQDAVMIWVTGSSNNVLIGGVVENTPGGAATASIKSDSGTMSTLIGYNVVTALALTVNTYNELNDGTTGEWSVTGIGYMGTINVFGLAGFNSGTDTSGTATASTPSLSTGAAAQVNTSQDVMLYANVTTASTFSLAIGPTSTPATTVVASHTAAIGLISVRLPKGWYVKSTFTSVTWTAITC